MSYLDKLREEGVLRPIDPDKPVYDGWRDDPGLSAWARNPAVKSKNSQKTADPKKAVKPVTKPTTCKTEGCSEPIKKNGLCDTHYKAKKKIYRDTRREVEKAQRRAAAALNGRACTECGDPVPSRYKRDLCVVHNRAFLDKQSNETAKKRVAEQNAAREERDRKRILLFEKKWAKIQAKYDKGE